jgi:glutathione S-transferase
MRDDENLNPDNLRSRIMVELYVFPPSPRAFKVMAVANYLGINWTMRVLDVVKGDHKLPEYAALNPNMRMPTLKEGDYVLWESNAIGQYLAGKRPESGLLPADEKGRLDVTRWQFWDLAHWDPACAVFLFENVVKPVVLKSGEPDPAAIAKGAEALSRSAAVLDGHLKGKKFVIGDRLTVADFSLAAPLNLAEMAHLPIEPYREIKRWYETLRALPAWQKTLAQCTLPAAAAA